MKEADNFLLDLNPPQKLAVTLPAEHAMILAGAGSGKTLVLTTRVAWLVKTKQVSPGAVIAVTFTNKAAREMSSRLSRMLEADLRSMWLGTFHGLANRLLRIHYAAVGLPASFQILDSQDQLSLLKRVTRALGLDPDRYSPKNSQLFINRSKEAGLRPSEIDEVDEHSRRLIFIYEAYHQQCLREGCVDFSELLLRSFELLRDDEEIRGHYQSRFKHILADEFQDANLLQYKWLKLLAGKNSAVFAVGDDDQSIYAFRGANLANMASFEREFSVKNLIKLEQNYRSHGHILKCANGLITNNPRRLGKSLWTEEGDGELVRVFGAQTDQEEARWITAEIQYLLSANWSANQIAVLYRSNAQSRVIEHELFSSGVPYKVHGGMRFFERAEVKNVLAYLRLIENPSDDGAFLRVVNFPPRGIGPRTLELLQDAAKGCSLSGAASLVPKSVSSKLFVFLDLIERMRADVSELSLPELVEEVIRRSGILDYYSSEPDSQDRLENVKELVNAAAAFLGDSAYSRDVVLGGVGTDQFETDYVVSKKQQEKLSFEDLPGPESGVVDDYLSLKSSVLDSPLSDFLAHASLESGGASSGLLESVHLMTVHAAKGLEFDAVFVSGLEEGVFPHESSVDEWEEERRLMYVAITRSRSRLCLSYAKTRMLHGRTRYHVHSRFLNELPSSSLKWLTPKDSRGFQAFNEESSGYSGLTSSGCGYLPHGKLGVCPFRLGQRVSHSKFGIGVITDIESVDQDLRARVDFDLVGAKWLVLSVANLEAV